MKKLTAAWLIALSTVPALVHAQGMSLKTTSGGDIGLQISDYKYEEDVNGAFFMSLAGKKVGLTGSFTQALDNTWYWGGDARYATGNTSYTSASTGSKGSNPDAYLDMRITTGKDVEVGSFLISPYAGFGYRNLSNGDSSGYTTTGNAYVKRTSTYIYIPIGLMHRFMLGGQSRISTSLEYDYLLEGTQRTYMSNLVGNSTDLINTQRTGHGARLNVAYETASWSAGVFYHYWNIQDSEMGTYVKTFPVLGTGYEPHNITREFGVQIKYRFN